LGGGLNVLRGEQVLSVEKSPPEGLAWGEKNEVKRNRTAAWRLVQAEVSENLGENLMTAGISEQESRKRRKRKKIN